MKKKVLIFLGLICTLVGLMTIFMLMKTTSKVEPTQKVTIEDSSFDIKILKEVNKTYDENYLISPYSIKMALYMLKEGADNNTLYEIDNLLKGTDIKNISSENIGVANGLFIKNEYKNYIEPSFQNVLTSKYSSEILYDEFTTPDVINKWVSDKTNQMIPNLLDDVGKDFVLGLANALAIDVKWEKSFDCNSTKGEIFNSNGKVINAEMMHITYEDSRYKYFETDDSKGVILPYEEDEKSSLEFIGILPNGDVKSYIDNLSDEKLNGIDNSVTKASDETHISLSLPRFTYDFDLKNFIDVLNNLGVKDVFDDSKADFTKIMTRDNQYSVLSAPPLCVSDAIHKTKIELNENGTKAAAVTAFMMADNAVIQKKEPKIIKIKFDKPFVYMIREKNTKEILFVGTLYEPNIWKGTTCTE